MTPLRWALEHDDLIVGWVCAECVRGEDSDDVLSAELAALVVDPVAHGLDAEPTDLRTQNVPRFLHPHPHRAPPSVAHIVSTLRPP